MNFECPGEQAGAFLCQVWVSECVLPNVVVCCSMAPEIILGQAFLHN